MESERARGQSAGIRETVSDRHSMISRYLKAATLGMKDQSKANSTGNGNHLVPSKALRLQNSTRARRASVAVRVRYSVCAAGSLDRFFSNVVRGQRLVSAQWIKSRDADRIRQQLHAAGYAGWRNCGRAELSSVAFLLQYDRCKPGSLRRLLGRCVCSKKSVRD